MNKDFFFYLANVLVGSFAVFGWLGCLYGMLWVAEKVSGFKTKMRSTNSRKNIFWFLFLVVSFLLSYLVLTIYLIVNKIEFAAGIFAAIGYISFLVIAPVVSIIQTFRKHTWWRMAIDIPTLIFSLLTAAFLLRWL